MTNTISKILCTVDCKFGAPMGRPNVGVRPSDKKILTLRVELDGGGYDRGGAYWGIGNPLYVEHTKDLSYIKFYRK